MSQSLYQKVGIASLIMMASVFLSRFMGLFRDMVVAYIGGVSGAVDAYQIAFLIPEILNHIVASGFLSVTFIPIFAGYLVENREDEGWQVFSIILNGFGSILLLGIVLSWVFAPELIEILAHQRGPAFKASATRMTRIIIPAQFFFFTGGLFMAIQFAKEKFAVPALAPLLYNLGIIAGGVLGGPHLGMEGFSWGVLTGAGVGNFAVQLWAARRLGMKYTVTFNYRHPALRKYVRLTLPLMLGLTMMFSIEIFIRFFGSYLPAGSIAALLYGRTIMFIPVGLFGQAVGMAAFPFMARLVAERRMPEMNALLNRSLRYLSLVIPFSVLLMVLRNEVVYLLFQRGQFDSAAATLTARILVFLLIGAFALSAYTVVVRGYHATQNTLFPAIFGTLAVLISLPLYGYGMKLLGVEGIALAVSVSSIFQVFLLYVLWNRRSQNTTSWQVYRFYALMILVSTIIGFGLEGFRSILAAQLPSGSFSGSITLCLTTGGLFMLLLLAAGYVFKIREIIDLADRILKKFRLLNS